jgi:hypothetical protein
LNHITAPFPMLLELGGGLLGRGREAFCNLGEDRLDGITLVANNVC